MFSKLDFALVTVQTPFCIIFLFKSTFYFTNYVISKTNYVQSLTAKLSECLCFHPYNDSSTA